MKSVVRVVSALLLLALARCAPDASNSAAMQGAALCMRDAKPCPNDPEASASEQAMCRSMLTQSGACSAEAIAATRCGIDNIACGADGMTDSEESGDRIYTNCMAQDQALLTCCAMGSNSSSSFCQGVMP